MKPFQHLFGALFISVSTCALAAATPEPAPIPPVDEVYPLPPNWNGTRVLHVGDSHVSAGLTTRLRQLLRSAGAIYTPRMWIGSRSKSWVTSGRLRTALDSVSPNVVIVTLGTNAMGNDRLDRYATWIEKLVSHVGPRRCFWLGPPGLLDDTNGFNEMAKGACRPCRYFDTRALGFEPRADGKFHLTREQGVTWADHVWKWMNEPASGALRDTGDAL